jgi:GNAT superfamily N-acetyltransferase
VIRTPNLEDIPAVFQLVKELAEYEKLAHQVTGNEEDLRRHVFDTGACKLLVTDVEGEIVGYALYFHNFSTFRMQPGIYLEDIYVTPAFRGKGYGKEMLRFLIELARESGYGRVEWSVLEWNRPAIEFYASMGAELLDDWRTCRYSIDDGAAS